MKHTSFFLKALVVYLHPASDPPVDQKVRIMHFSNIIPLVALATSVTVIAQDATITVQAPVSTSSSYTDDSSFRDDMLEAHNFYRQAHNASDLEWNETSARFASRWADGCEFEHSVCTSRSCF